MHRQAAAILFSAVLGTAPALALPPPRPPSIEPPFPLPELQETYPDLPDPGPRPRPAAWTTNGVAICDAPGDQSELSGTDDLAHGAFLVWRDRRSGGSDIYGTRMRPDGSRADGWNANGTPICIAAGEQSNPRVVTDRASGAWVYWTDERDGASDLYVQRVQSDGTIPAGWPANGRRIAIIRGSAMGWADLEGGLMLFWEEPSGGEKKFRRLHLDALGDPVAGLPAEGRVVFENMNERAGCSLWNRAYASAFFRWPGQIAISFLESRDDCEYNNCTGCYGFAFNQTTVINDQDQVVETRDWGGMYPRAIHDGVGGILMQDQLMRRYGAYEHPSWQRYAPGGLLRGSWNGDGLHFLNSTSQGTFVLRIADSGPNSPGWGVVGVPICVGCASTSDPLYVHDGAGGVILLWRSNTDLVANWIRGDGSYGWLPSGLTIPHGTMMPGIAGLIGNRRGDAIAYWQDSRNGNADLWAYRLSYDSPPASPKSPRHAIEASAASTPIAFTLDDVAPNPSAGDLAIRFQLPRAGGATVSVIDVAGRVVLRRTLEFPAGAHSIALADRSVLAPGVYVVRLEFAGAAITRRVVVVR